MSKGSNRRREDTAAVEANWPTTWDAREREAESKPAEWEPLPEWMFRIRWWEGEKIPGVDYWPRESINERRARLFRENVIIALVIGVCALATAGVFVVNAVMHG